MALVVQCFMCVVFVFVKVGQKRPWSTLSVRVILSSQSHLGERFQKAVIMKTASYLKCLLKSFEIMSEI